MTDSVMLQTMNDYRDEIAMLVQQFKELEATNAKLTEENMKKTNEVARLCKKVEHLRKNVARMYDVDFECPECSFNGARDDTVRICKACFDELKSDANEQCRD